MLKLLSSSFFAEGCSKSAHAPLMASSQAAASLKGVTCLTTWFRACSPGGPRANAWSRASALIASTPAWAAFFASVTPEPTAFHAFFHRFLPTPGVRNSSFAAPRPA